MGYRSDVVLVLDKSGVAKLKDALAKAELDGESREAINSLLEHHAGHLSDSDTGSELWYWEGLKWYADYPDVAFFENFMANIADLDNYRFMRIGEDQDDIEVEGCYLDDPFDLRMERQIKFAPD